MPNLSSSASKFALGVLLLCSACDSGPEVAQASQAACTIEVDGSFQEGADGIADRFTRRHFDEQGRVDREDIDSNGDGGVDQFTRYRYNDDGQWFLSETFQTGSETLLSRAERAFDSEGREVLQTLDRDADLRIDQSRVTVYEGAETLVRTTEHGATDYGFEMRSGPLGVLEIRNWSMGSVLRSLYRYNDRGQLARVETYIDGVEDSVADHRYNDIGQKTTSLWVRDGVETLQTYSHDERGFINGWVEDKGRDGIIDGSAVCVFDDEGRMIAEDMDRGNDGVVDYVFATSFDAQGRVLFEFNDEDGETGAGERLVSYRYDCP